MCDHLRVAVLCSLLVVAGAGQTADNSRSFHTAGLKIGQSEPEVRAALQKFNPKLEIRARKWSEVPGVQPSSLASLGITDVPGDLPLMSGTPSDHLTEYLYTQFGQTTGRTYLVAMAVSGSKVGDKVLIDGLVKDIEARFGKTDKTGPNVGGMVKMMWTLKKDGTPDRTSTCESRDFGAKFFNGFQNFRPNEQCGISAGLSIWPLGSTGYIGSYQIAIYDHQEHLKDIRELERKKAEAQQKKLQQEKTEGAGNKARS